MMFFDILTLYIPLTFLFLAVIVAGYSIVFIRREYSTDGKAGKE